MTEVTRRHVESHLKEILRCQIAIWDAGDAAERLLGCDVTTRSERIDDLCVGLTLETVDDLTWGDLVDAFELNELPENE